MSRRSRRRRGVSGGVGWLGKSLIGMIVIGVIGCGVLYTVVRGYLHSDGFRQFLSDKAGAITGVTGSFAPFRWDGLAVDSPSFQGTGRGIVKDIRLDGLHTEVGVSGLGGGAWLIKGTRFQRLEMKLDTRRIGEGADSFPRAAAAADASEHVPGWLPRRVELQGLDVDDISVDVTSDQGEFAAKGVRARVNPAGGRQAYKLEVMGGTVTLPFNLVPDIRIDRAKLRYQDGSVSISSANARVWKNGRIDAAGEWSANTGQYSVVGTLDGVKCEEVFNEDWAKRCIGDMRTDFTIDNRTGQPSAYGRLDITNGTLTALPLLDSLAAYADTRRFRVLVLNDAHTDWHWKDGTLVFSNIVLSSDGLIRLEGALIIRDGQLDGTFRLGLAPGTLATIPGAETDVFSAGERGLLWTSLRITGTLDDPKEDLTDRLIAAAGIRMFDVIPETGEKVIKFTRTVIQDAPSKAIDAGSKVIETVPGIVEGVGGVIDGIFGVGPSRPQPEEKVKEP